jgi:hypothetical protein
MGKPLVVLLLALSVGCTGFPVTPAPWNIGDDGPTFEDKTAGQKVAYVAVLPVYTVLYIPLLIVEGFIYTAHVVDSCVIEWKCTYEKRGPH